MTIIRNWLLTSLSFFLGGWVKGQGVSYGQTGDPGKPYDLVIKRATIFDTRSGKTVAHRTILIRAGMIVGVQADEVMTEAGGKNGAGGGKLIDARGRLVTPGLMDIHSHLTNVLGDYDAAPLDVKPDSAVVYRRRNAQTYLPYGITTIRIVGEPEQWIPMTLDWQKHPASWEPDVYTCGAALVSTEPNRKTYINHVVVNDPADAERKIQQYYDLGIRDIKLYWRLRYPEFTAALRKAESLQMHVCAHVDRNIIARDSALALGLRDLEHFHPYGVDLLSPAQLQQVQDSVRRYYSSAKGGFLAWEMEVWKMVGMNNAAMLHSIALLKKYHASLTPTIHIFGQALGFSYIKTPVTIENGGLNAEDFNPVQRQRCLAGYRVMVSYIKRLYAAGVPLNVGTDSPDGGKATLSEMLVLHALGIPMPAVLRMATLNDARAIGREGLYGTVEKGKRADLLIFSENPLERPEGLVGEKLIIKDGVLVGK